MNNCNECKGKGYIELLHSRVECECRKVNSSEWTDISYQFDHTNSKPLGKIANYTVEGDVVTWTVQLLDNWQEGEHGQQGTSANQRATGKEPATKQGDTNISGAQVVGMEVSLKPVSPEGLRELLRHGIISPKEARQLGSN